MTAMLIALNFIFPNVTKIDEIMDEKKKKFKNQKLNFFKEEMNNNQTFIIEWGFFVQILHHTLRLSSFIIEQNRILDSLL